MEPRLLATAKEFISGYWPHLSGGAVAAVATVGTAIFAYIRRPRKRFVALHIREPQGVRAPGPEHTVDPARLWPVARTHHY